MPVMLADTHTHLQFPAFEADREQVVARAVAAGVERMVVVGIDLPSSRAAVALAERWPEHLVATVGVHPHEAASLDDQAVAELRSLAGRRWVVAVGEVGLDFYRDRCPRDVQRAAFLRQQALARELRLPLVIHCREAVDEVYQALDEGGGFETRVIMHCFSGRPEQAERYLAAGCWLGLDGPVTYPKADGARALARMVPADRLLLETDCPYLAPQPVRGRRCEPAHVAHVAERIAAERGVTTEQLAETTTANAARVFGWEAG